MKTLYNFLILTLALLIQSNAVAQTGSLEYTYDLAGNRIMRKIILLYKTPQTNDTTHNTPNDSTIMATNANNNADELQHTDSNANNNGVTGGAGRYIDNIGEQKIVIFPNPTSGSLQVKITPFNTNTSTEISVYDLQSHLLLKEPCNNELSIVDLSKYAKGSYILRIRIGDKQREWKVVKE